MGIRLTSLMYVKTFFMQMPISLLSNLLNNSLCQQINIIMDRRKKGSMLSRKRKKQLALFVKPKNQAHISNIIKWRKTRNMSSFIKIITSARFLKNHPFISQAMEPTWILENIKIPSVNDLPLI